MFELEHVVVEELLEFLVSIVNTQLLEAVVLEDLKTRDVQNTNKVGSAWLGKNVVNLLDNPQEEAVENGTSKSVS